MCEVNPNLTRSNQTWPIQTKLGWEISGKKKNKGEEEDRKQRKKDQKNCQTKPLTNMSVLGWVDWSNTWSLGLSKVDGSDSKIGHKPNPPFLNRMKEVNLKPKSKKGPHFDLLSQVLRFQLENASIPALYFSLIFLFNIMTTIILKVTKTIHLHLGRSCSNPHISAQTRFSEKSVLSLGPGRPQFHFMSATWAGWRQIQAQSKIRWNQPDPTQPIHQSKPSRANPTFNLVSSNWFRIARVTSNWVAPSH